jgi:hypothetical protein
MDEISDNDFREFVKTVQDLAIRAYPNPDRVDCPGSQVIREIASQSQPSAHPVFQSHVVKCSPCIQDLLAERTRIQSQQKSRRRLVLAIAACICLVAVTSIFLIWRSSSRSRQVELARAGNLPEVPIDLRPYSPRRSESTQINKPPLTVPNERVKLKIYLAPGSPEGEYEVAVLTNHLATIVKQQATAVSNDGTTFILAAIDLAGVTDGNYTLALRPIREGEEWQTYKLQVQRRP